MPPARDMSLRHHVSRCWLALSISFFLFAPYLSRFTDAANRFYFQWVRSDLFALLFAFIMVGFFFFLCYELLYLSGNAVSRKMCEIFFILLVGVSLVANISSLVKLAKIRPSGNIIALGIIAWVLTGGCMVWLVHKHGRRIKAVCMALCFILSPLFPVFTLTALRYPSLASDIGELPASSAEHPFKSGESKNVYLFIFDEWSYQRSFKDRQLIQAFPHLRQFASQALVFHSAQAPSINTATALPSILYQTRLRFLIGGQYLGFKGSTFHPIDEVESIFRQPRELGYFTAMIGSTMPFGDVLGGAVDYCRSIPEYKWFGDNFFGVARYHLLTAALLLPAPLFHYERSLIADYFFNKFRVRSISTTHDLVAKIVTDQERPTFAVCHYMIPHLPYIFTAEGGHKDLFASYEDNDLSGYYDNLAYTDKKIGDIIRTLREAGTFDASLIIFTADHGWRFDPDYDKIDWYRWGIEVSRVPIFIKLPYQKRPIEIDIKFETFHLGNFINRYLDGQFSLNDVELLLRQENSFKPVPLEEEITQEPGK